MVNKWNMQSKSFLWKFISDESCASKKKKFTCVWYNLRANISILWTLVAWCTSPVEREPQFAETPLFIFFYQVFITQWKKFWSRHLCFWKRRLHVVQKTCQILLAVLHHEEYAGWDSDDDNLALYESFSCWDRSQPEERIVLKSEDVFTGCSGFSSESDDKTSLVLFTCPSSSPRLLPEVPQYFRASDEAVCSSLADCWLECLQNGCSQLSFCAWQKTNEDPNINPICNLSTDIYKTHARNSKQLTIFLIFHSNFLQSNDFVVSLVSGPVWKDTNKIVLLSQLEVAQLVFFFSLSLFWDNTLTNNSIGSFSNSIQLLKFRHTSASSQLKQKIVTVLRKRNSSFLLSWRQCRYFSSFGQFSPVLCALVFPKPNHTPTVIGIT